MLVIIDDSVVEEESRSFVGTIYRLLTEEQGEENRYRSVSKENIGDREISRDSKGGITQGTFPWSFSCTNIFRGHE